MEAEAEDEHLEPSVVEVSYEDETGMNSHYEVVAEMVVDIQD